MRKSSPLDLLLKTTNAWKEAKVPFMFSTGKKELEKDSQENFRHDLHLQAFDPDLDFYLKEH